MAFQFIKSAVNNVITGSLLVDNCTADVVEISLTNAGITYASQTLVGGQTFVFSNVTRVFYSCNVSVDGKLKTYRSNCFADGRKFEVHRVYDRKDTEDGGYCVIYPCIENSALSSNQIKLVVDPRRPGLKWRGDVITQYDVNYRDHFEKVLQSLKILRFQQIQGEDTLQLSSRKIKDIFLNLRNKLFVELVLFSGFLPHDRVLIDIRAGSLKGMTLDGVIEGLWVNNDGEMTPGIFNVRIDDTPRARRCQVEGNLIAHVTPDRLRLWKRRAPAPEPLPPQIPHANSAPFTPSSIPPSPDNIDAVITTLGPHGMDLAHSHSTPLFDISVSHTSPSKQPNVHDIPSYELNLDTSNKFANLKSNVRYDSYLNDLTRELMEELGLDDRQMTRKFISAFKGDLDVCRDKFEDSGGKLLDVFQKTHFVQLVFPYKPLGFRFSVDLSCHHPYITFVNVVHEFAAHIETEWDIISINNQSLYKATQKQVQSILERAEMPLKIIFLKNFKPPPPPELVAEWTRLNERLGEKHREDIQHIRNLETDVERLLQSEEAAMRSRNTKIEPSMQGASAFISEGSDDLRLPDRIMSDPEESGEKSDAAPPLNRATSLLGIREMAVADARHFEYPTRQAVFRLYATGLDLENLIAAKFLEYEVHYVQSCFQAISVAVGDQIDVSELSLPPGWHEHQIPGSCKIVYRHEDGRVSLDHPNDELWVMLADSSNQELPYAYPSVGL